MPSASSSPVARRWELAARLRALRVEAGRSIEEASTELMCSTAKISRMETAGRGAQPRDIRDLCRFYGVPDAVRDDLMRMAAEARRPGWWHEYTSLDESMATFIGLETAAREIRTYEAALVPGLLQTSEFTAAMLPQLRPPGELSPPWIEEAVAIRRTRQERITSGDLRLHAIIDEAALARPVGDDAAMAAQVKRLLAEAQRANVTLQVIPFARGPHPGLDGSFQVLGFPAGRIDDVVYVEGLLGNFILDKQAEVAHYRKVFDDLARRVALPTGETLEWLTRLHERFSAPRTSHRPAVRQRRTRAG